jgi:hypothetical protein
MSAREAMEVAIMACREMKGSMHGEDDNHYEEALPILRQCLKRFDQLKSEARKRNTQ